MSDKNIKPEKITKPIQLLAVWLIGLILIESSLLTAAGVINEPGWLPVFFGISAVSIIPVFLILIFLLQTKYRPQIQEDEYYSKYLDKNTMQFVDVSKKPNLPIELIRKEMYQIVKETQNNLINIKSSVDKGESKERLESLISNSDSKISELEKIVKYASINLHINKTINSYREIIAEVKKIGFPRYEEFGEEEIPQNFLVSFTKTISPIIVKELLVEIIPHGATYVSLVSDEQRIEREYGDAIFIGSYLYNKPEKTKIDQIFLNKLASVNEKMIITDLINE